MCRAIAAGTAPGTAGIDGLGKFDPGPGVTVVYIPLNRDGVGKVTIEFHSKMDDTDG